MKQLKRLTFVEKELYLKRMLIVVYSKGRRELIRVFYVSVRQVDHLFYCVTITPAIQIRSSYH